MDISMLAPDLARLLGIQPTTMVLLLIVINRVAAMTARAIPNDAIGWKGVLRQAAAIVGTEVPTKLTSGVTVADAAKAALLTPPITQKVEKATGVPIASTIVLSGASDEDQTSLRALRAEWIQDGQGDKSASAWVAYLEAQGWTYRDQKWRRPA